MFSFSVKLRFVPVSEQNSAGSQLLYRERLSPGLGVWLMCLGAGLASFFVAAPINMTAGYIVAVLMALLLAVIFFATSPTIEITPHVLRVGRAQIEREFVGKAEAFRGEDARIVAGPALDGRAFMCFRGWIEPKVRIEITDPADPTPYWLASTRNPEKIVEVLGSAS